MKTLLHIAVLSFLSAPAAFAESDLPPGLQSARLLAGWQIDRGKRMVALDLTLLPGWKTYWRVPGDSGIPPEFDWSGSQNLQAVVYRWPAPQVIVSGGEISLGFHDRMVLPIEIIAKDPDAPTKVTARVTFGLCEDICVPADLTLTAPPPDPQPDAVIQAALDSEPKRIAAQPPCRVDEIADGMRVSLTSEGGNPPQAVAMELKDQPEIWVSPSDLSREGEISAEFVAPGRKPFPLDTANLLVTTIRADGATETLGCTPAD